MLIYVSFHLNLFLVILLLNNVLLYNIFIIRFFYKFFGFIYFYFSSSLEMKDCFIFIKVFYSLGLFLFQF